MWLFQTLSVRPTHHYDWSVGGFTMLVSLASLHTSAVGFSPSEIYINDLIQWCLLSKLLPHLPCRHLNLWQSGTSFRGCFSLENWLKNCQYFGVNERRSPSSSRAGWWTPRPLGHLWTLYTSFRCTFSGCLLGCHLSEFRAYIHEALFVACLLFEMIFSLNLPVGRLTIACIMNICWLLCVMYWVVGPTTLPPLRPSYLTHIHFVIQLKKHDRIDQFYF